MSKFGIRDVCIFKVYDKDGLCFTIDTTKETALSRDFRSGENRLVVDDALVDIDVLNDILHGKYDGKKLRIVGDFKARDLAGKDHDTEFRVTVAELSAYSLPMGMEPSVMTLEFRFPTFDAYGFMNAMFEVK